MKEMLFCLFIAALVFSYYYLMRLRPFMGELDPRRIFEYKSYDTDIEKQTDETDDG